MARLPEHLINNEKSKSSDREFTEAVSIRERFLEGALIEDLAEEFDRSMKSIRLVLRYESFPDEGADIKDEVLEAYQARKLSRTLDINVAKEIRDKWNGEKASPSLKELADEYDVSRTTIWRIVHNKIY